MLLLREASLENILADSHLESRWADSQWGNKMYLKGEIMNLIAMSYQVLVYTCSHDPSFGTKVANGNLNRQTSCALWAVHLTDIKGTAEGKIFSRKADTLWFIYFNFVLYIITFTCHILISVPINSPVLTPVFWTVWNGKNYWENWSQNNVITFVFLMFYEGHIWMRYSRYPTIVFCYQHVKKTQLDSHVLSVSS